MIKLVAFDWNGTLFDDSKFQFQGFNAALKHFKRKPISFARFRQTYDVPFSRMWKLNGGKVSEMAIQDKAYFDWYNKNSSNIPLKQNAEKILNHLLSRNIKSIIFSNHPSALINKDLSRLKINKYIHTILGRPVKDKTSHYTHRSKATRLQKYLETLHIAPQEVLCVGDTIEEIEISKVAKFISVALTTGDCSITRLKKVKPNFLIRDLIEIKNILDKIK